MKHAVTIGLLLLVGWNAWRMWPRTLPVYRLTKTISYFYEPVVDTSVDVIHMNWVTCNYAKCVNTCVDIPSVAHNILWQWTGAIADQRVSTVWCGTSGRRTNGRGPN
jgi:hypothetical protein